MQDLFREGGRSCAGAISESHVLIFVAKEGFVVVVVSDRVSVFGTWIAKTEFTIPTVGSYGVAFSYE